MALFSIALINIALLMSHFSPQRMQRFDTVNILCISLCYYFVCAVVSLVFSAKHARCIAKIFKILSPEQILVQASQGCWFQREYLIFYLLIIL